MDLHNDFQGWASAIQQRTEQALDQALPAVSIIPNQLHEAMRYATLGGGQTRSRFIGSCRRRVLRRGCQ
ncbi:Geranyltranstransferase (fragment) [Candidatus Methylopumilus turicensis]|uniref:Geranyltranstransferase n=1 Tax=Candidatus Methylopumilus turicensis TaxID=1581680 RepID=A0A0B7ITA1_9PROT